MNSDASTMPKVRPTINDRSAFESDVIGTLRRVEALLRRTNELLEELNDRNY